MEIQVSSGRRAQVKRTVHGPSSPFGRPTAFKRRRRPSTSTSRRGRRAGAESPVQRPATYELVPGENLGDLIRMAGGFRPEADRRRLQIERVVPPQRRTAVGMDRELFEITAPSLEAWSSRRCAAPT